MGKLYETGFVNMTYWLVPQYYKWNSRVEFMMRVVYYSVKLRRDDLTVLPSYLDKMARSFAKGRTESAERIIMDSKETFQKLNNEVTNYVNDWAGGAMLQASPAIGDLISIFSGSVFHYLKDISNTIFETEFECESLGLPFLNPTTMLWDEITELISKLERFSVSENWRTIITNKRDLIDFMNDSCMILATISVIKSKRRRIELPRLLMKLLQTGFFSEYFGHEERSVINITHFLSITMRVVIPIHFTLTDEETKDLDPGNVISIIEHVKDRSLLGKIFAGKKLTYIDRLIWCGLLLKDSGKYGSDLPVEKMMNLVINNPYNFNNSLSEI
jgi:hypothetical protein